MVSYKITHAGPGKRVAAPGGRALLERLSAGDSGILLPRISAAGSGTSF